MATATATKSKRTRAEPRYPERKWGPFAGGIGVAVWLNEFTTDEGTRYARTITLAPRRFKDKKTGEWRNGAYRPVDLAALLLAIKEAQEYCLKTPLPGDAAEPEEVDSLAESEVPPNGSDIPY
jgi:hypothetical protein